MPKFLKNENVGEFTLFDFKNYYEAKLINRGKYSHKNRFTDKK